MAGLTGSQPAHGISIGQKVEWKGRSAQPGLDRDDGFTVVEWETPSTVPVQTRTIATSVQELAVEEGRRGGLFWPPPRHWLRRCICNWLELSDTSRSRDGRAAFTLNPSGGDNGADFCRLGNITLRLTRAYRYFS